MRATPQIIALAACIAGVAPAQAARDTVPADAWDRLLRSNAVMAAEHVPINPGLPVIESETEVHLPSTEEVAMRAVATIVVAIKGDGGDKSRTDAIVREYRLEHWLSPKERVFLADPNPSEQDKIAFSWRYEDAEALLWSLGFVPTLDPPRTDCDPDPLVALVEHNTRAQFLAQARLRPLSEILDQDDLIYRYRWALVDARANGKAPPASLHDDVAVERQQALNWLVRHADEPWDDVDHDT